MLFHFATMPDVLIQSTMVVVQCLLLISSFLHFVLAFVVKLFCRTLLSSFTLIWTPFSVWSVYWHYFYYLEPHTILTLKVKEKRKGEQKGERKVKQESETGKEKEKNEGKVERIKLTTKHYEFPLAHQSSLKMEYLWSHPPTHGRVSQRCRSCYLKVIFFNPLLCYTSPRPKFMLVKKTLTGIPLERERNWHIYI